MFILCPHLWFTAGILLCLPRLAVGADQTPLQTTSLPRINQMTAYGNTLVTADSTLSPTISGAEATGGVYLSYYDDLSEDFNLLSSGELSETKLYNPYKFGTFGNVRTDASGNAGFGQSLAMVSETELFISAASMQVNTGRGT